MARSCSEGKGSRCQLAEPKLFSLSFTTHDCDLEIVKICWDKRRLGDLSVGVIVSAGGRGAKSGRFESSRGRNECDSHPSSRTSVVRSREVDSRVVEVQGGDREDEQA